jgi:hypothetical protein
MRVSSHSTKKSPGAMRLAAEAETSNRWIGKYDLQHFDVATQA